MKKIAFVRLRYLPPSETFIYEELKNIKRFKPIVFTRKRMNLKRFPYPRIKKLPRHPGAVARLFKKKHIKLIHARFGNAGVRLIEAKRKLRIPMLTSFHGFDLPSKKDWRKSYHRILPRLFRAGDRFTVPSRHMKRQLIRWGCPRHKIKIMYSGIDLNKFPYVERESKTEHLSIIAVGRLHEKKGFDYLIRAFKRVSSQHPTSRLIIIGEGEERRRLERLIKKLKLKGKVSLKGLLKHDELSAELGKADLFCLPSVMTKDGNHEGIPNAIKEAMASGLPVVSTKHGGIPELVSNGKEGFLVPERSVSMLADTLSYLMERPSLRQEMGKQGRAKVERCFDSAKQVKRLEAIYRKLIRKRWKHG